MLKAVCLGSCFGRLKGWHRGDPFYERGVDGARFGVERFERLRLGEGFGVLAALRMTIQEGEGGTGNGRDEELAGTRLSAS
jgi:hypothetical protein